MTAEWRTRLTYTVMSLFLVWHIGAILLGPAPASEGTAYLRTFMQPYLSLLKLDNRWDFYAPGIDTWRQFRYSIQDSAGKSHDFIPGAELSHFHPDFWWQRGWYDAIMDSPEEFGDYAVETLCRKHAALHPVSITLLKVSADAGLTREEYLKGIRPTDADFATTTTLKQAPCKS